MLTYLGDTPDNDLPDLSTDYWAGKIAKTEVRRGMPKVQITKLSTTIRLDPDDIEAFKAEGAGWQSRINSALRKVAKLSNVFKSSDRSPREMPPEVTMEPFAKPGK